MLDVEQFRDCVIKPSLQAIGLYSLPAEQLLLGTAVQESRLTYLKQLNGPALGIYQMEPNTYNDIWDNYLKYNSSLATKIGFHTLDKTDVNELVINLDYATIMCRLQYYRQSEKLPEKNDIEGFAMYWKKYYNTEKGKGTIPEFYNHYKEYVEKLYK